MVAIPEATRVAVVTADPLLDDNIALYTEHTEVLTRIGDRLHRNKEQFAFRLVLVLETELGTDFRRAEIEIDLFRTVVDLLASGAVLEAEFGHGTDHELDFGLGVARHEGGFAEEVVSLVADAANLLQGCAEVIGGFEAGTKLERPPGLEVLQLRFGEDHFVAEEPFGSLHASELVENRFDADIFNVHVVFHDAVLFLQLLVVSLSTPIRHGYQDREWS